MKIGDRIKEVRNKLNMSQVSFADKINVSKQTLYKYENNLITNIPSDKIEAIAKIGNTTPAYLMGWTSNPEPSTIKGKITPIEIPSPQCNNDDEQKLLLSYRTLSTTSKKKVLSYCIGLAEIEKADYELNAAHQRTDIEIPKDIDTTDNDIMDNENF